MAKKSLCLFVSGCHWETLEPGLLMVPPNVSKATFLDHLFHIQVSLVFSTARHPNSRGDSTCANPNNFRNLLLVFIMIGLLEVWLENKNRWYGITLCSLPYSNAINTRERGSGRKKLFNLIELGSFFIGHFLSLLLRLKVKRIYLILIYSLIFFFCCIALQGEGKWSSQNKTTPVGLRDRHGGGHRLCFEQPYNYTIFKPPPNSWRFSMP